MSYYGGPSLAGKMASDTALTVHLAKEVENEAIEGVHECTQNWGLTTIVA